MVYEDSESDTNRDAADRIVSDSNTVDAASSGSRRRNMGRRKRDIVEPSTKAVEDPGADLERRVGRVEFAEGALVRLRVPVRVAADVGRAVLTDLDVLALDIDFRLRLSRSILECKSGKGQSGEPDRLLWLAGLRQFVSAERAVLVRQTVSRRGRTVASSLGIEVQDVQTLSAREAAHAWLPERFAHIGGKRCEEAETRTDTQLKALNHISHDLAAFLRYDSLLSSPNLVLSALVSLGESLSSGGAVPDPTGLILSSHGLVALLVAAVTQSQYLDMLPRERLQKQIELSVTVGDPEDDHVLSVLDTADQILNRLAEQIHEQYIRNGATRADIQVPSLRNLVAQPPEWVPRYMDLLEAMRANPQVARDLPQTAELACFDALLGDVNYNAPAFAHLFTAEHRQLLRVAVRTLKEIVGPMAAERLARLNTVDFDRTVPSLPDRRAPLDGSSGDVQSSLFDS